MLQKSLFDGVIIEVKPAGVQYAAQAYQDLGRGLLLPIGRSATGHTPVKAEARCRERLAGSHRHFRRVIH